MDTPTELYPLRFQPILRRYLWGGRRLGERLGKPIGDGNDYAESWEIVDRPDDQSVVAHGPLAGQTLRQLVHDFGPRLLGAGSQQAVSRAALPGVLRGRFPLLLKFLDARLTLSVQVHPNDEQAAQLAKPDLGKTEAWYVLAAETESRIYAGLLPGIDRFQLERAAAAGRTDECLHWFHARPGDCVLIPAGTIHAIGAGILLVEIQQASDTTYRLFDWNRLDAAGRARPLHVIDALDVTDFARGPIDPVRIDRRDRQRTRLVECREFFIERWTITGAVEQATDGAFRILVPVAGSVRVVGDRAPDGVVRLGDSLLVPAACERLEMSSGEGTAAEVLVIGPGALPTDRSG